MTAINSLTDLVQNKHARDLVKLKNFKKIELNESDFLIWCGESDEGVRRNLGRNGSLYGPRVILNQFSQMIAPAKNVALKNIYWNTFTSPYSGDEKKMLELSNQQFELPKTKKMIHLGCGHDHVYHLLKHHLLKGCKKFFILNFDAHPDMRLDNTLHSGTPFRKFFMDYENDLESFILWQTGLQKYYVDLDHLKIENSKATIKVTWMEDFDLNKWQKDFKDFPLERDTLLILSIDLDVMSSSEFSSVSAPNPSGLNRRDLVQIIRFLKPLPFHLGLYEFNPLISDDALSDARYAACLLFEHIF